MAPAREGGCSMSSIEAPRIEGSWEECNQTGCTKIFFRYVFGNKCYSLSDKIGTCPLCLRIKQEDNGTLRKRKGTVSDFVHHKSPDAKPEADSL